MNRLPVHQYRNLKFDRKDRLAHDHSISARKTDLPAPAIAGEMAQFYVIENPALHLRAKSLGFGASSGLCFQWR